MEQSSTARATSAMPYHPSSPLTPPPASNEAPVVASGVHAVTPPTLDPQTTMQRADEINTIQRMFSDKHTSAVMLIGSPGVGKSTLAALLYRRLQLAKQSGLSAPRHLVWLTIGNYTTIPDLIAAMLNGLGVPDPGLFLLKPDQQISSLLRALRRSQENALIILDQFELLLHPETNQGAAGRGVLTLFLDMLQTDLGASRILITGYHTPYDEQKIQDPRVRSYLVSRISMPEGVALLQQRGVYGSQEELSLIWQRCTGHVFALVLFSTLSRLSGLAPAYMLQASEYKALWSGDVTTNLIIGVHHFLNPIQNAIAHAISLFHEPAPKEGIIMTVTGNTVTELHRNGNQDSMAQLEQELAQMSQAGLIQPVTNIIGMLSYTIHPMLRQYILEHFMEDNSNKASDGEAPDWSGKIDEDRAEDRQAARANGHTQVAAYYRQLIPVHCAPRGQRTGTHDIEPILAAIRHLCLGWRWQRACDLLFEEGLHESMVQWGAWNTLIGIYTAMLPPFGVLLRRDEATVAGHVGTLYGRIGEHQQSKNYFEQALGIQEQINDIQGEAITRTNQGELQRMRGEHQQARQNFERALTITEQTKDQYLRCIIQHNLGLLAHQSHHYEQAHQHYTEALQLAYQLKREQYRGMILTNMGMLLYEEKHYHEALALLFAALELRQKQQDPTAALLERFLIALEQKMGPQSYARLSNEALAMQPRVFSRLIPTEYATIAFNNTNRQGHDSFF